MHERDRRNMLNAPDPKQEEEKKGSGSSVADVGEGAEVGLNIIGGASEFVEKTIYNINETGTALLDGAADAGESMVKGAAQITGAVVEHVGDVAEVAVDAAATVLSGLLDF
jgi:hypothetical protein